MYSVIMIYESLVLEKDNKQMNNIGERLDCILVHELISIERDFVIINLTNNSNSIFIIKPFMAYEFASFFK